MVARRATERSNPNTTHSIRGNFSQFLTPYPFRVMIIQYLLSGMRSRVYSMLCPLIELFLSSTPSHLHSHYEVSASIFFSRQSLFRSIYHNETRKAHSHRWHSCLHVQRLRCSSARAWDQHQGTRRCCWTPCAWACFCQAASNNWVRGRYRGDSYYSRCGSGWWFGIEVSGGISNVQRVTYCVRRDSEYKSPKSKTDHGSFYCVVMWGAARIGNEQCVGWNSVCNFHTKKLEDWAENQKGT